MMDTLPNPTNAENDALARRCETVAEATAGALDWLSHAGETLAEEAPAMARTLRREAMRARKLANAARRPMCVSVFGPSQQGKSYLIASLARKGTAPAMIRFGDEVRGFNRDINPDGGKESTGLVTRFSIRPVVGLPGMPVVCRMLSQTDIVKIMANAFMEDFDRDSVVPLENELILATLARLRAKAAPARLDRLHEDDVYELHEYFERYFRNHPAHTALKQAGAWREMESLAPRLSIPDRTELFALLWNLTPTMTRVATKLIAALAALDFPEDAFAPLAALEPKAKSIIDVATMLNLAADDTDMVPVATRAGRQASLPRSVLTAVVAELHLQLADKPFDFFDHTDLLDFPGARSREKYNAQRAEATAAENLFMLFRRGKVAYLYQRYLAEQELTSMLLCLRDSNQEVRSVPAMVTDWIESTHGATPQARAGKDIALFLVLTMFDKEFATKSGASDDSIERWSIRLDTTLFSYLGLDHTWPEQWTQGRPFANTFWLRNPEVHDKGLLDYDSEMKEIAFREPARMDLLKSRFIANTDVQKHFADPALAWDAAMKLNDGGIGLISERLRPVCNPVVKRRQVEGQLGDLAKRVASQLEPYHVSGDLDAELAKRRAEARGVGRQLLACAQAQAFGLLLRELQVPGETLSDLFRRAQLDASATPSIVSAPVGARASAASLLDEFDALFDEPGAPPAPKPAEPAPTGPADLAELFAETAMTAWLERILALPGRPHLLQMLRIDRDAAASLAAQLGAGARRLKVREVIATRMRAGAAYHGRLSDRLLKPVMIAERAINDYVTWLNFDTWTINDRPKAGRDQRAIFLRPRPAEAMPTLKETPMPYDATYYVDWAVGYVRLVEDNVRGAGGAQIDIEANAKLGRLLASLRTEAA